jgi:hypothetical protein
LSGTVSLDGALSIFLNPSILAIFLFWKTKSWACKKKS